MTSDEIREALRQKVKLRWSEYKANVLRLSSEEIFERTDEIAVARFCYDQLTENLTSYPMEYLEHLLRFDDPLSVAQDQWASAQNVDYSGEFEHVLQTIWNTREVEQGSALVPVWTPEQSGPSMC